MTDHITIHHTISNLPIPLPHNYGIIYHHYYNDPSTAFYPHCHNDQYALMLSCGVDITVSKKAFEEVLVPFFESQYDEINSSLQAQPRITDDDNYTNLHAIDCENLFRASELLPDLNDKKNIPITYSNLHMPNTINPDDAVQVIINSKDVQSSSPKPRLEPNLNQEYVKNNFISLLAPFDMVKIIEMITTTLNSVNFNQTLAKELSSHIISLPNQTLWETSQSCHIFTNCKFSKDQGITRICPYCHTERVLRSIRNILTSSMVSPHLCYFFEQIATCVININIIDLTGTIINVTPPINEKEGNFTENQLVHEEQATKVLPQPLSIKLPSSTLSYPFGPFYNHNNNVKYTKFAENSKNIENLINNNFETLFMYIERNHWGMVLIVYENNQNNRFSLANNEHLSTCSDFLDISHQKHPFSLSTGIYLLFIHPNSRIPPHYHTILDEYELNMSHSISFNSHYSFPITTLWQGNIDIMANNIKRSTWGLTNHWTAINDSEENVAETQQRNDFVHCYNNPTPYWATILCMSSPAFIPGDEIILNTRLYYQMINAGHVPGNYAYIREKFHNLDAFCCGMNDNSDFPEDLNDHKKSDANTGSNKESSREEISGLPLYPSNMNFPWLGDHTWNLIDSQTSSHNSNGFVVDFPGCLTSKNTEQRVTLQFSPYHTDFNEKKVSINNSIFSLPDAVLGLIVIIGENTESLCYKQLVNYIYTPQIPPITNQYDDNQTRLTYYQQPQLLFTTHSRRGIELPGGKVNQEDHIVTHDDPSHNDILSTIKTALKRELLEETGVDIADHMDKIKHFARYIITERNYNDFDDSKATIEYKDVCLVVLSYADAGLFYDDNGVLHNLAQNNKITQHTLQMECDKTLLRPLFDIIPSLEYISRGNTTEISPLLQDQVFPMCLRRVQALVHNTLTGKVKK